MTKSERNNWIVNIENTAAAIESQLGSAVVESVFKRYKIQPRGRGYKGILPKDGQERAR